MLIVNRTNPLFTLPAAAGFEAALAAHSSHRESLELHGRDDGARGCDPARVTRISKAGAMTFPSRASAFAVGADHATGRLPAVRHARTGDILLTLATTISATRCRGRAWRSAVQAELARDPRARRAGGDCAELRGLLYVRAASRRVGSGGAPGDCDCAGLTLRSLRISTSPPSSTRRARTIRSCCSRTSRPRSTTVAARIYRGCRSCRIR